MKTFALVLSAVCVLSACSASTKGADAPAVTVTHDIPWTYPNLKVNRVSCPGVLADCIAKASVLCSPTGAVVQTIDDHDIIFLCRPKQAAASEDE